MIYTEEFVGRTRVGRVHESRVSPPRCTCPAPVTVYRRRLAGASFVTFSVEKAVTGLLRIASRLYARPGLAAYLAPALHWLIPPHCQTCVFEALTGQISAGMLRLVLAGEAGAATSTAIASESGGATDAGANQWAAVLSVLEACARVRGRGEAETFEAVCLLVHNQDLKVRVEMFCVLRNMHWSPL